MFMSEFEEQVDTMIQALENTRDEGNEMCAKRLDMPDLEGEYMLVVMTKRLHDTMTQHMSLDPRSTL